MAPPKRKRPSTRPKAIKKPRYADSSDTDTSPSQELWKAERILQEKRVGKKLLYLIQWEGIDPATGKAWLPTWEPEDNPNEDLLAGWLREKAVRGVASARKGTGSKKRETPKKGPGRKTRVVESSPESGPSTAHPSPAPSRASTVDCDTILQHIVSSTATTPIDAPAATGRALAEVLIRPPGDFDPDEYERYLQLAASQSPSPPPADSQGTDLDSSQLFAAAAQFHSSGVVQDSQSSAGEGSFIPATQQTTGTTQPSSAADATQEEEDVTEDSGLLDIVQQAASRAPSPARSIPETIYETTADSQSQRRNEKEASQERTEIPDTLELEDESLFIPENALREENELHHGEESQAGAQAEDQQIESESHEQVDSQHSIETAQEIVQPQPSQETPSSESQQQDDRDKSGPAESLEGAAQPVAAANLQVCPGAPIKGSNSSGNQTTQEDNLTIVGEQDTQSGAVETTLQHVGSQDNERASLAEHSEQDETAQFPFHSQHPLHISYNPAQPALIRSNLEQVDASAVPATTIVTAEAFVQTEQQPVLDGTSAISPIRTSSHYDPSQSQHEAAASVLVSSTQAEEEDLLSQYLEPEFARSQSPAVAHPAVPEQETVVQSSYASHSVEEAVRRRDFALESQPPRSTDQSTASQNAQFVPALHDLSTQEDTTEDIRPSIEKEDEEHSSPASRHDSSQDTPERQFRSSEHSSSPIPQPPSHSLNTFDSHPPPRPRTPLPTSSLSNMASQDTGKSVEEKLKALLAEKQAQKPFTPRRMRNSAFTPSPATVTPAPAPAETHSTIATSRRLLRTGASEGTRSPSTVPARSPAPPAPTSLRTVALSHSSQPPVTASREKTPEAPPAVPLAEVVEEVAVAVPAIVTTEPTVPEAASSGDEELSDADVDIDVDADDDTGSLLNDDLQLAAEEYVVPLFIEGRQSDMYCAYIKQKQEVIESFLNDPNDAQPLEPLEDLLTTLRAVETHIDLVFAEAGTTFDEAMDSATQVEFAAQFGMENSTKFRFLHSLFHTLRHQKQHLVLVVEDDDDSLFTIIETFCKANYVHYNMPTMGRQADPSGVEGDLLVTVFPRNMSPIIRPPSIIVCLDGVQDANNIREKNWAMNPELEVVPVLHLIIPRTVGHIERYLSPSLEKRERVHTIIASLAQMSGDLGKPIDEDTPRAPQAACLVSDWLLESKEERGLWPLTSIGSVKDVIEYQTQVPPTTSPAPERAKRPHDDEELDPAKRMRFTPQPQAMPNSSIDDNEITRISDSMPGTATDDASALRAQIKCLEGAYQRERSARRSEETRYRDQEVMWDKQQAVHEDLTKEYRLLLGKHQKTEESLATATTNNETLRERLATRTTEIRTLTAQLDEQRKTDMLSPDAQIVEITQLRTALALATTEKEAAIKSKLSTDSMLDYTKEEYRKASDDASTSRATIAELNARIEKLSHAASGQPVALKKSHLGKQHDVLVAQVRNLKAENATLKKALVGKEEELLRSRERPGVRTRGGSATPKPERVGMGNRSRAASPRLSGLRNG